MLTNRPWAPDIEAPMPAVGSQDRIIGDQIGWPWISTRRDRVALLQHRIDTGPAAAGTDVRLPSES